LPGFTHDLFSAFYPLAVASPVMGRLGLEDEGLEWRRAEVVVSHPVPDGPGAGISVHLDESAASLDACGAGDGAAWRRLFALWQRVNEPLLDALFSPFPPVAATGRLVSALGSPSELARFARLGILPARRFGDEFFAGPGGRRLIAGSALHADLSPESAAGGLYGWLLCAIGQQRGWPVPAGGAGRLSEALRARLLRRGGQVRCDAQVTKIEVRAGRAVGVALDTGERIESRRAVLSTTSAPALYDGLLAAEPLPRRYRSDLNRFQWDNGTVKVNWALSRPIPWTDELSRRAGTVHVADGVDALSRQAFQLVTGAVPDHPFLVVGQYASFDDSRAPAGQEAAWAYTHVPQAVRGDAGDEGLDGTWDDRQGHVFADRMEAEVERLAPGFRASILARDVMTPPKLAGANPNLVGGALNAGTAQLQQQLVFRPAIGSAGPGTPIDRLFLAGASAHPGGGVHGAAGANAARAAVQRDSLARQAFFLPLRASRRLGALRHTLPGQLG
jgi:phytoene dehydrogenase-like protein